MTEHFAEWVAALGPEIANHLWQSTAFAAGAWLVTLALRANQARVRYGVWLAASLKLLVPFSLLIAAGNLLPHPKQAVAPMVYSAIDVVEEPFAPTFAPPPVYVPTLRERAEAVLPVGLFGFWVVGAGIVVLRWARSWRIVRRILREAQTVNDGREWEILRRVDGAVRGPHECSTPGEKQIPSSRRAGLRNDNAQDGGFDGATEVAPLQSGAVELRLSVERMEPGIFGVWRPVLVWPRELSARLDDAHIEAIVAHELAHVRRRDNLSAALHMLVETLFWFHPLVWWMERCMVKEREQACDEAVVELAGPARRRDQACGDCSFPLIPQSGMNGAPGDPVDVPATYAETYAEALLKTCRFCIESPLPCVAGVTGADLKQRVLGIVTGRALLRLSWPKKLLLAAAAISVTAAPIVLGQAKAAQRLMLAAIEAAPKPVQKAAKAMMGASSDAASDADMALGPAFEVATIRPGNTNDGRHWFGFMTDASGRFTGSDVQFGFLVSFSYSDMPSQVHVSGGPAWVKSDVFDINAKIDDAYMPGWDKLSYQERNARVKPMLRTLLAQRFKLKLHVEMKPTPVYVLVQAKGGAKVKEVPSPPVIDNSPDGLKNWNAEHPGEPKPGSVSCSGEFCTGTAMQMKNAIGQIGGNAHADRMVIDGTNLKGFYDFKIPIVKDDDPDGMLEVEDALGMKFEARTVPVKTFVIDSVERPSVDGAEVDSSDEGQLNGEYRKWLDEDVHWLIAPEERAEFLKLGTDKDRDAFIDGFWEKRDAPGGAKGAYKAEAYARIAYANAHFSPSKAKPGWATDRGRAYIVYGKPDSIRVHPGESNAAYEVWFYDSLPGIGSITLRFDRTADDYQLSGPWPQINAAAANAKRLEFEVVSLRPSNPQGRYMVGVQVNADGVTMNATPLTTLICVAYGVSYWQLSGIEPWMAKDKFDFQAKPPQGEGIAPYNQRHSNFGLEDERLRQMMQAMLADRFHLKLHLETTTGTVSILEQSGKPLLLVPTKLKFAKGYGEGYSEIGGLVEGRGAYFYNMSMPQLTRFLSDFVLHRPVLDKTGLDGAYDYEGKTILTKEDFEKDTTMDVLLPAVKEMGLKLTETQGPVEKLAIDHAEQPTAN